MEVAFGLALTWALTFGSSTRRHVAQSAAKATCQARACLDSVVRVGRPVAQHDDSEDDETDDQAGEQYVFEVRRASLDAFAESAQHPEADGCGREHVAVPSRRVGFAPWIHEA